MDYPLEKMFDGCFFCFLFGVVVVLIRHHIFWEIIHVWEFQKNGTKKVKEKTLAKEKVKGMLDNLSPQATAGHNRGPPQQTCYSCKIV